MRLLAVYGLSNSSISAALRELRRIEAIRDTLNTSMSVHSSCAGTKPAARIPEAFAIAPRSRWLIQRARLDLQQPLTVQPTMNATHTSPYGRIFGKGIDRIGTAGLEDVPIVRSPSLRSEKLHYEVGVLQFPRTLSLFKEPRTVIYPPQITGLPRLSMIFSRITDRIEVSIQSFSTLLHHFTPLIRLNGATVTRTQIVFD